MKLEITHKTQYRYDMPVFLHPQWVRLNPRHSQRQEVCEFILNIDPAPVQINMIQGFEGSLAHHVTFQNTTSNFIIQAKSVLVTKPATATLHLYPYETTRIPFGYSSLEERLLEPFLHIEECPRLIRIFAENVLQEAGNQTLPFLFLLTRSLANQIQKEYREFGWPYAPEETLRNGRGSCRDTAVLFIACARYIGIAARFVSGYIFDEFRTDHSELHAWVEVYLPGAGWYGYDPSYGLLAGEGHVDICASAFPQLCAPIEGSFTGAANQSLAATVTIKRLD